MCLDDLWFDDVQTVLVVIDRLAETVLQCLQVTSALDLDALGRHDDCLS